MGDPRMVQTMRWFGPPDPVSLEFLKMSGVSGIVTSLHQIPNGQVWEKKEILERKRIIEERKLTWSVVESVPVHEDIKVGAGNFKQYVKNYCATIRNLGACGIRTVCYNFMPLLDWTRTDLTYPCDDGSLALAFSWKDLAVFDIYILKRPGASTKYGHRFPDGLNKYYKSLSKKKLSILKDNMLKGLPGSEQSYTLKDFIRLYQKVGTLSKENLQHNLVSFLKEVVPVAEEANVRLAIHPDDPPVPLFDVPRVVSTEADLALILNEVNSPSNGFTFCTGSYGVNPANDLPGMVARHGRRLHFIHLRNIITDSEGNFFESNHLDGDVDMGRVVQSILKVMRQRGESIPMRPDHGHRMLYDISQKKVNPGYTVIGRLRGLAELRGLEQGILAASDFE